MKIIKKFVNPKTKKGVVTVLPNNEEDIWYLYNIIMPGDVLKVSSFRKIKKKEGDYGVKKVDRKQIIMTVGVMSVDFQSDERGTTLNLKTKNLRENEWVMLGQVQTIEVKLFSKLQIIKDVWDKKSLELLDEASDDMHGVDSLVVLFDDGFASFFFIKKNFTKQSARITKSLPKKKSNMMDIYNKRIEEFDQKIWRYIFDSFDMETIKVAVVAGPGNAKNRFVDRLKSYESIESDPKYRELGTKYIQKFVAINTSSTFKSAINEIMKDPKGRSLLENTKAVKEMEKLEEFFGVMMKNPNCAVYGEREVIFANDSKAIKYLLICDSILRAKNFAKRKKFTKMVEEIESAGAQVFVLSENHVSGQKLKEITGIAAVLKFPIDLDFDNEDGVGESLMNEPDHEELFQNEGDLNRSFIYDDNDLMEDDED
jgi:protein pelota